MANVKEFGKVIEYFKSDGIRVARHSLNVKKKYKHEIFSLSDE